MPALLYQLLQRSHFRLQLAKAAPISLAPSSPGEPTLLIVLERCDEIAHEAQDVFSHVSGFLGRQLVESLCDISKFPNSKWRIWPVLVKRLGCVRNCLARCGPDVGVLLLEESYDPQVEIHCNE